MNRSAIRPNIRQMLEKAGNYAIYNERFNQIEGWKIIDIIIVIAGACIERAVFIISELLTDDCFVQKRNGKYSMWC